MEKIKIAITLIEDRKGKKRLVATRKLSKYKSVVFYTVDKKLIAYIPSDTQKLAILTIRHGERA